MVEENKMKVPGMEAEAVQGKDGRTAILYRSNDWKNWPLTRVSAPISESRSPHPHLPADSKRASHQAGDPISSGLSPWMLTSCVSTAMLCLNICKFALILAGSGCSCRICLSHTILGLGALHHSLPDEQYLRVGEAPW